VWARTWDTRICEFPLNRRSKQARWVRSDVRVWKEDWPACGRLKGGSDGIDRRQMHLPYTALSTHGIRTRVDTRTDSVEFSSVRVEVQDRLELRVTNSQNSHFGA
jgi:predicted  nucleic acid-binding Zn ribbon protein